MFILNSITTQQKPLGPGAKKEGCFRRLGLAGLTAHVMVFYKIQSTFLRRDNLQTHSLNNFDISNTVTNSNTLHNKLKRRFSTISVNRNSQRLLYPTLQDQLLLLYMKLLSKLHKLDRPPSHNNIFVERDISFPLIYTSMDLLNLLGKLYITKEATILVKINCN